MVELLKKVEIEKDEKQMMRDVFVEKAWTIIRKNFSGRVLDLGCGPGLITYNHENSIRIDILRTRAPPPFIIADARRMPFKKNSFDTLLMSHVLEHFNDCGMVLKECLRVLKPSGKIIVAVPNLDTFSARFFGERYGYVFNREQHLQHFDSRKLRENLSKYFNVERMFGTTPTFPYADYLMNLKPFRRLWWVLGDFNSLHDRDLIAIAVKQTD
jgi:ubiquinone/menaquinone biosynthesis C-methylase UbiE